MAIPAGIFMKKYGYKKGIILGLLLFATGAFSFIPAALMHSSTPFLIALFIIACGLCILETAANPYSTVLGPKESAAQRINLSQSFNGLGWILGPLVGGALIFGTPEGDSSALTKPYISCGQHRSGNRYFIFLYEASRNQGRWWKNSGYGKYSGQIDLEAPPFRTCRNSSVCLLCRPNRHIQFLYQLRYRTRPEYRSWKGIEVSGFRWNDFIHGRKAFGEYADEMDYAQ